MPDVPRVPLAELTRMACEQALARNNNRVSHAARELGISFSTLRKRVKPVQASASIREALANGPLSIYEIARLTGRRYQNVSRLLSRRTDVFTRHSRGVWKLKTE